MSRVHRHTARAAEDDAMSNASLGTAAAFKTTTPGGLFLKDGDYNVEFLQNFITKPLRANKAPAKPIRQPVLYSEIPEGFKPRTVIYFKKDSLENDAQQRGKFKLLDREQQQHVMMQAKITKEELFQERKKVRKAWNTPAEKPGELPKPPPRVSLEERKARKAKAEAELDNRGALVETVMVPDPSFGAGEYGKRIQIQAVAPPPAPPPSSYNPSSYNTPVSPSKSQFGDDDDDLEDFKRSPPMPIYENHTQNELRLMQAARSKAKQADFLKKKVSRLENFVGDLKKSITTLKEDPSATLLTQKHTVLGEKSMLGLEGGELAAAINVLQQQQQKQADIIKKLTEDKESAEKHVKKLQKDLVIRHRASKESDRESKRLADAAEAATENLFKKTGCINKVVNLGRGDICEFLTDIEGNYEYFLSFVERSKVLSVDADAGFVLSENGYLVHGGDGVDKGPGDIRVVKALSSLKRRYPSRVFLIMGNRDVNKLRFLSELSDEQVTLSTDIYWDRNVKSYGEWCEEKGIENKGKTNKLKWMLECTMGSQKTFETRRMELAIIKSLEDPGLIPDEEVVASFVDSVNPKSKDCWMLDYIKLVQVVVIIQDCLFVHGGIDDATLCAVPTKPDAGEDALDWCKKLNAWKMEMVAEYVKNPKFGADGKRSFDSLLDYGLPGGNGGRTVCYNSFVSDDGNFSVLDEEVESWCTENDLKRIFVGHTPQEDSPGVMKRPNVTVFMCDTSYSDVGADKKSNPSNNRGSVLSMVRITRSSTSVEGSLKSGAVNKYVVNCDDSRNNMPDSFVGRQM
eukprot:CAMPEP_0118640856 /NCGR_PEP_ID=MMETSP0785-20121206/4971_1 /TAXON_ID=91992 /ORGANISM="Bolidomonas pacifica, Strain CCMP 1866" /LENGTH=798 /DNA_ID=CAMNT_0006532261 /DNA_START=31 /DNA_END=2424 /DNA_ORIENTATION=+